MKNIFSKINKKELFLILLAPVSFISIFFLTGIIQNVIREPIFLVYINRLILFVLLILISIFSIKISSVITKIFENKKRACILRTIWIISACLYLVSFVHPTGQGIFFLEVFVLSLVINLLLTYTIALIIKVLNK